MDTGPVVSSRNEKLLICRTLEKKSYKAISSFSYNAAGIYFRMKTIVENLAYCRNRLSANKFGCVRITPLLGVQIVLVGRPLLGWNPCVRRRLKTPATDTLLLDLLYPLTY